MDLSGYLASDLDDVEFYWEKDQLKVDAVFRSHWYPFSPTAFDHLEMGGSAENPILRDEKEDKENSPPTTPISERPARPPALLRTGSFGIKIRNVSRHFLKKLFQ